jgi:hypothetical protein
MGSDGRRLVKYDATLKALFTRSAGRLLTVLAGRTIVEWINVELPRVNLPRMDLLGRLDTGGIFQIEFQTANEPRMAERMAVYYLETFRRYGEYPEQIVLYLGKDPLRMATTINTPRMKFEFRLVDIGELDGDELLVSGDVGDAILGVLARVTDRDAAIRPVLERIATLKGRERQLALEQLMILSGLRGLEPKVRKEAKNMPFVIDLMENEFYREAIDKGRAKGRMEVLQAQLTRRFGRLPAWSKERLESATPRQLEAWALKVLDAKKLEDVLGKPAANGRNGK